MHASLCGHTGFAHLLAPGTRRVRLVEARRLVFWRSRRHSPLGATCVCFRVGGGACRGGGSSTPTCRGRTSRARRLPRCVGARPPPGTARGSARSCGLRLRSPPSRRGPAGTSAGCRDLCARLLCSRSSTRGRGAPTGRSGCARACRGHRSRRRRSAGRSWRHTATLSVSATA